jgi:hypothetical protein
MEFLRVKPDSLKGKTIDIHSHVGINLKAFINLEYPYAQTIEGLYCQQRAGGVDINVVFPFTADLFFDPHHLAKGQYRPAHPPICNVPYSRENEMLLYDVYRFNPDLIPRFLPFVSLDPGREISRQIQDLRRLSAAYPVYGIKISPVLCQSKITNLLDKGQAFMELAREKNWPVLLHTTSHAEEEYSRADLALQVVEKYGEVRFCLAHCVGFDREYFRRVQELSNAWVDTAALKIQVQLANDNNPITASPSRRIEGDYTDHRKIMRSLMEQFPDKIIWGTDSPAYAYICRRQQGEGVYSEFRLKAVYRDETDALHALPASLRTKASNTNSLAFLFGST